MDWQKYDPKHIKPQEFFLAYWHIAPISYGVDMLFLNAEGQVCFEADGQVEKPVHPSLEILAYCPIEWPEPGRFSPRRAA